MTQAQSVFSSLRSESRRCSSPVARNLSPGTLEVVVFVIAFNKPLLPKKEIAFDRYAAAMHS